MNVFEGEDDDLDLEEPEGEEQWEVRNIVRYGRQCSSLTSACNMGTGHHHVQIHAVIVLEMNVCRSL